MQSAYRAITVNPKKVARVLGVLIALLMVASIAGQVIKHVTGHDHVFGFVPKSYVGKETTVPTYFSSILFLASAVLLGVIVKFKFAQRERYRGHWAFLSALFLYLSVDDSCGLHEVVITPLQTRLEPSGLFYFAWMIPALPLIALLAVAFLKFVLHLPRRTRYLVVTAGAFCLGGGVGFEMIGGWYREGHSASDPIYLVLVHVEELLEMIGLAVFIYALLEYIGETAGKVVLQFESPRPTEGFAGAGGDPPAEPPTAPGRLKDA